MLTPTPAPPLVDMQVACAHPAVKAYQDAAARLTTARFAYERAAHYADFAAREYITTTKVGRESRARAFARRDAARQELAAAEAPMAGLARQAWRAHPEAMARLTRGEEAARAYRAAWSEEYGPVFRHF